MNKKIDNTDFMEQEISINSSEYERETLFDEEYYINQEKILNEKKSSTHNVSNISHTNSLNNKKTQHEKMGYQNEFWGNTKKYKNALFKKIMPTHFISALFNKKLIGKKITENKKYIKSDGEDNYDTPELNIKTKRKFYFVSKIKNTNSYHYLKDVSIGTSLFIGTSVFIAIVSGTFSYFIHDDRYRHNFSDHPLISNNSNGIVSQESPWVNLKTISGNIQDFDKLTPQEQFIALNAISSNNEPELMKQALSKLSPDFDKQQLTTVLFQGNPLPKQNWSDKAIQTKMLLLQNGANFKVNNYQFLQMSLHSDTWRNYWIEQFKNDKQMLAVYSFMLKQNINPTVEKLLKE